MGCRLSVGAANFIPALAGKVPVPPLAAFVVGFVLYLMLAKAGLRVSNSDAGAEHGPLIRDCHGATEETLRFSASLRFV